MKKQSSVSKLFLYWNVLYYMCKLMWINASTEKDNTQGQVK